MEEVTIGSRAKAVAGLGCGSVPAPLSRLKAHKQASHPLWEERDNPYNSMPICTLRLAKFFRENSPGLANPEVTDLTQEFRTRPHKFSANLTGGSSLSRHPQFLLLVAHRPNKESQGRRVQIKTQPRAELSGLTRLGVTNKHP